MEVEKTGSINYKIFKKRDIESLIKFFIKVNDELDNENTELRLAIKFKDGTSVRGVNESILDETKMVQSIYFTLRNFRLNKKIELYVSETRGHYEVASVDLNWVDAKFSQIEEIFKVVPNQNYWLSNYRGQALISNLFGVALGIILYFSFFLRIIDKDILEDIRSFVFLVFASVIIGQLTLSLLLNRWLFKLYPKIEFDTTLAHINKNKKRKALIGSIAVFAILPLCLNLFSSLVF